MTLDHRIQQTLTSQSVIRDLGNGLILRSGRPEDEEELAAFNGRIFRNTTTQEPNSNLAWWTRDLVANHVSVRAGDFTVVEDAATGKIVSSLVWISQTWSYGGIEFGVGRPELVGTHDEYRNRGIVRAQFDIVHDWSAARGELAQAITGIPYFYRQFGYEMALQLGAGRAGYKPHAPKLKKDEPEPYRLRRATRDDLAFIMSLYAQRSARYLVDCVRDDALWRYELDRKSEKNATRREICIIEDLEGQPVGLLAHPPELWGVTMAATLYELSAGVSWVAVTPSVIRYLWATGEAYKERDRKEDFSEFAFDLGGEHPVYTAMADHLPNKGHPYAWYVRVPDIPAFLRRIAPALETNLEGSVMPGYTGDLKLNFYRSGVRLAFEHGRISIIEPWKPTLSDGGNAAFPDRTFLQLLFGYRSSDELRYAFPDCWAGGNAMRALLDALFPKRDSDVWPLA
ncbi:MAG: GNAT family N-acetyltransferase [Chloroflexi bacterium]|nr:GNAT family N-acetyltransferase [Chloroflexota bacterium]